MFWFWRYRLLGSFLGYAFFSFLAWLAVALTLWPVLVVRGPAGVVLLIIWLMFVVLVFSAWRRGRRERLRRAAATAELRARTAALVAQTEARRAAPPY